MRFAIFIFVLFVSACGSTRIAYQPKDVSLKEANLIVEQMIMTQHQAWKPSYFVITDHFLGWDYGNVTKSSSWGSANAIPLGQNGNALAFGSASTTSQSYDVNERVYYNTIEDIHLYSWKRKAKQWYLVSLVDKAGHPFKHILHTRNLADAELMMDALSIVLDEQVAHSQQLLIQDSVN